MLIQLIDIIGCRSRKHALVGQPDDRVADRTIAVDAPAMQRAPGQVHRAEFEAGHFVPRRNMIERRLRDGRHNIDGRSRSPCACYIAPRDTITPGHAPVAGEPKQADSRSLPATKPPMRPFISGCARGPGSLFLGPGYRTARCAPSRPLTQIRVVDAGRTSDTG
jgi:hypothetical protein